MRIDRALRLLARLILVVACGGPAVAAEASGRSVTFEAADGTVLAGLFYESASRSAPGVVFVHMLNGSKDDWGWLADRLQGTGATVLAFDLRGHGGSHGSRADLAAMAGDVRAAVEWLATRPGIRPGGVALVGASLGASLAAMAAAAVPVVRAVALVSPSLDYRGVRIDAGVVKKLGDRPIWLAASTEDPYALRTLKELAAAGAGVEQRLGGVRAHGTMLLSADADLSRALVDWLRRSLIF